MSKEFYARLAEIQEHLNAPKNQYNSFGKYKYRSCEDILEGVKPLLKGLFLSISDEIVLIGNRYYVKATATITDGENSHSASAIAREEENKKGMDAAQVTGATSSYARKYCLNGLFGIDDAKDADTDEHKQQQNAAPAKKAKPASSSHYPEQVLKAFSEYAATETDKKKLIERYQHDWQLLAGNDDAQTKCVQVMNIRINELKQVLNEKIKHNSSGDGVSLRSHGSLPCSRTSGPKHKSVLLHSKKTVIKNGIR